MTIAIINGEVVEVSASEAESFEANRAALAERLRVSSIKEAAAELINAIAPIYKQQNYAALRLNLLTKRIAGELITEAEIASEIEANAVAERIDAIRAVSKAAVREGLHVTKVEWPQ